MTASGRMGKAREAAVAVIKTASANDYINVVAFSSTASSPNCFPNRFVTHSLIARNSVNDECSLVRATSDNKRALVDYVMDLSPGGSTNFVAAFIKACF